jgi:hypothetical protein
MASKRKYRVVSRAPDGSIRIKDYTSRKSLLADYSQAGVDDCSTDLTLRGEPVLATLVGPMTDSGNVARYETPDIFETLTKEWAQAPTPRRRSRAAS